MSRHYIRKYFVICRFCNNSIILILIYLKAGKYDEKVTIFFLFVNNTLSKNQQQCSVFDCSIFCIENVCTAKLIANILERCDLNKYWKTWDLTPCLREIRIYLRITYIFNTHILFFYQWGSFVTNTLFLKTDNNFLLPTVSNTLAKSMNWRWKDVLIEIIINFSYKVSYGIGIDMFTWNP